MKDVARLHKIFRSELTAASQSWFVWKNIHNTAASDQEILRALNCNALSWTMILHSLQCTFFMTLGRIFDVDSDAISVHALLRTCKENIDQFSRDALRARKITDLRGEEPDWLDEYINAAYVPLESDFQLLRGDLSKKQKEYEAIYRPIRSKLFAHKDKQTSDSVDKLFGQTRISQIEGLLSFLHQIEQIIFNLLYNGRLSKIGDHSFDEEEFVRKDVKDLLVKLSTQHCSQ